MSQHPAHRLAWLGVAPLLALFWACGEGPAPTTEATIDTLALGARLIKAPALQDARAPDRLVDLTTRLGRHATVIIGWSVPCPCTQRIEARVSALIKRYGDDVRWIGLAGEPQDTRAQVLGRMRRMGATYDLLLDPQQRLCARLGIERSAQAVILDGTGRLVYRGGVDGDFPEGQGEHLRTVLDLLVASKAPEPVERELAYGCRFGEPASCTARPRAD